jgi:hypothetical protein
VLRRMRLAERYIKEKGWWGEYERWKRREVREARQRAGRARHRAGEGVAAGARPAHHPTCRCPVRVR